MTILAVFPLSQVQFARSMAQQGRYNWALHAGEQMPVSVRRGLAVTCNKAPSWLHCGADDLAFCTNVFADMGGRWNMSRSVYIDVTGKHVHPG